MCVNRQIQMKLYAWMASVEFGDNRYNRKFNIHIRKGIGSWIMHKSDSKLTLDKISLEM